MARTYASRVLCWAVFVSLALAAATERPARAADARTEKTVPKGVGGRLPNYYKMVVDEQQRQEIYRIQAEYRTRIKELETRLKALKKERDQRIVNVLSPEQKKRVEEAAARAKEKRAAKAAKKAQAECPPAPEPKK